MNPQKTMLLASLAVMVSLFASCKPEDKPDPHSVITPGDTVVVPDVEVNEYGPSHDTAFEVNGIRFLMKYIPAGHYYMGASSLTGSPHYDVDADDGVESPVHEVHLSGFLMAETEVNTALYYAVTNNNPSPDNDIIMPVRGVSFSAANAFLSMLSSSTGFRFRMPTEAEWEYAAREAGDGFTFSGSNDPATVAWFEENADGAPRHPGLKQPNALGIYDLTGNVAEWCSDWYGEYSGESQHNPTGASMPPSPSRQKHVARGGSYLSARYYLRNTWRDAKYSSYEGNDIGIRLVMSTK